MNENRDFLKEMEELRAETGGIKDALVSKTGLFNSLLFDSGVLKEIVGELKAIRKENKEIKEKNDRKIEELTSEMMTEIAGLKAELLQETQEIRQKLEEIEKKNENKLSDLQNRMLQEMKKMQTVREVTAPEIPIREAIVGEWKMVDHENFETYEKTYNRTFKDFSLNLNYKLINGKLLQSDGVFADLIEGGNRFGEKDLYVEDNHLKTFWSGKSNIDRYIENGKLNVIRNYHGGVWKRVYEKI